MNRYEHLPAIIKSMNLIPSNLAKHVREVHTGGNWTCVNLETILSDITLEEATQKVGGLNSIATLSYHIHYYFREVLKALNGEKLNASDKDSFITPDFKDEEMWNNFKKEITQTGLAFASKVETLDPEMLTTYFEEEKYGSYFRNLVGIIEHTHYHLGQMSLIKKMIR